MYFHRSSVLLSQTSLQAVNATLEELKLDRDQVQDEVQVLKEPLPPSPASPAVDTSALWEAIERLDAMVVNHTVKVSQTLSLHLSLLSVIDWLIDLTFTDFV